MERIPPQKDACVQANAARIRTVFEMNRPGLLFILLIPILSGCRYDPKRFQLPELQARHPEVGRRVSEYHDPYPDDTLGPGTNSRPRGFDRQRTATRRAAELRAVHLLEEGDLLPSQSRRPPKRYSQVVEP